ncbi:MAG: hypothetical protein HRF44_12900 [Ignavibacterium sp.]
MWQIDTIGAQGVLYDVAILDENNIWAVGEIYLRDANGQIDPLLYNVARWDGTKWNVQRVTVDFRGNLITPELEGTFLFSSTDIWLVGSLPIHGDGSTWQIFDLRAMPGLESISLSKAWGTSSDDIYFVGRNGSIAHYNGSSWQKIESGTDTEFRDIHGSGSIILSVASSSDETVIQSLSGGVAIDTLSWPNERRANGIWVSPAKKVFAAGDGVWQHVSAEWLRANGPASVFYTAIRGNADNDIVTAAWGGNLAHYNGYTWMSYPEIPQTLNFRSLAMKGHLVVAVGFIGTVTIENAAILMGRRN